MPDITRMLQAAQQGDTRAAAELFPILYEELRRIAAAKMAREAPGQTLQATDLVHEAWLKLGGGQKPQCWENRAHFFGAAAEAMRQILVDRARRRGRLKRGGNAERVEFDELQIASPMPDEELLALDEALKRLAEADARAAEVVKLSFFIGLTHEQIAEHLGVSVSTVERTWSFARAWLFREIRRTSGSSTE